MPYETHPVWVDDDRFNLDYHVRHTALPQPGDDRSSSAWPAASCRSSSTAASRCGRSGSSKGSRTTASPLISKTHHCMIDGVSAVDLATVLLSASPEAAIGEIPPWHPRPAPSRRELAGAEARRRMTAPLTLGRAALGAIRNPREMVETALNVTEQISAVTETLGAGFSPASDSLFNQPIGPHRRFDWTAFDLSEVKRVKNRLGGTVNDAVLAIVAGAVGSFLRKRGVAPEQIAALDFRAMVPVSLRPLSQRGTLGNRIASWAARLPIAETDPRRRLQTIRQVTGDLKQSRQAMGAEALATVSEWTVPTLLSLAMRLAARARSFNLTVTNVPGPQIPLYMAGARMQAAYPLGPLFENQALNIALLSYDSHLHWGFNADYDVLPDLADFCCRHPGLVRGAARRRGLSKARAKPPPLAIDSHSRIASPP